MSPPPSRRRSSRALPAGTVSLGGALLAPVGHGIGGNWDEIVLSAIAFGLFGAYVMWLRKTRKDGRDDEADATVADATEENVTTTKPGDGA